MLYITLKESKGVVHSTKKKKVLYTMLNKKKVLYTTLKGVVHNNKRKQQQRIAKAWTPFTDNHQTGLGQWLL